MGNGRRHLLTEGVSATVTWLTFFSQQQLGGAGWSPTARVVVGGRGRVDSGRSRGGGSQTEGREARHTLVVRGALAAPSVAECGKQSAPLP